MGAASHVQQSEPGMTPMANGLEDDADMKLRVLGCSGAIASGMRQPHSCVDGRLLVDAGTGVADLRSTEMAQVDHGVLLTLSHA